MQKVARQKNREKGVMTKMAQRKNKFHVTLHDDEAVLLKNFAKEKSLSIASAMRMLLVEALKQKEKERREEK